MIDVTVITPIAPHHTELFSLCAESVRTQTVKVNHLYETDDLFEGPGAIRNRLAFQAKTKYLIFLDADDYMEPEFVEKCLSVIRSEWYVYTHWFENGKIKMTPRGAWWDTAWHLVTCLMHKDMFDIAGGFDETLPGMEDTDLFLKFDTYGYCGLNYPEPLVHYTPEGKRSAQLINSGKIPELKREFNRRYPDMGCCGSDDVIRYPTAGAKLPGDVRAMALWKGNRVEGGAVSGRRYRRISRPRIIWIDPRDAKARPDLWRILDEEAPKPSPLKAQNNPSTGGQGLLDVLHASGMVELPSLMASFPSSSVISPDFQKIAEFIKRG